MKKISYGCILLIAFAFQISLMGGTFSNTQDMTQFSDADTEELVPIVIPVDEENSEIDLGAPTMEAIVVLPAEDPKNSSSEESGDQLNYVALEQASHATATPEGEWTTGEEIGVVLAALAEGALLWYGPKLYNHSLILRDGNRARSSHATTDMDKEAEMRSLRNSSDADLETRGTLEKLALTDNEGVLWPGSQNSSTKNNDLSSPQYVSFRDGEYQPFITMRDFWDLKNSAKTDPASPCYLPGNLRKKIQEANNQDSPLNAFEVEKFNQSTN